MVEKFFNFNNTIYKHIILKNFFKNPRTKTKNLPPGVKLTIETFCFINIEINFENKVLYIEYNISDYIIIIL